jgi:hypothetical protein
MRQVREVLRLRTAGVGLNEIARRGDATRRWERRANIDWATAVLGLLVTPRRRTSVERARGLRPWQMERAAILGDRVLEPHFDRR